MNDKKSKNLIIFGNRQLAEIAHFYFTRDSDYKVVGFLVDDAYRNGDNFCGLPVYYDGDFTPEEVEVFVAISDNYIRAVKCEEFKTKDFALASYISTKCVNWSSCIGEHCFVLENNVLQPFTKIGSNNILWSGNHIGHHSVIHDHVFITSHVVVCGNCEIGSYSFVGVNSSIRDGVKIAERSFVCMDTMVHKNTQPGKKYLGVPCKEM